MTSTISIEIEREVVHATRMKPVELKRELAISLFQQGKLSFGKTREMTGMSAWSFQQMLGSRGIPVHYDSEEYEEDLQTLRELDRLLRRKQFLTADQPGRNWQACSSSRLI